MKTFLIAAAFAVLSLSAVADESDIKRAVESKIGKGAKIIPSPIKGLWEVNIDNQIFYADEKGSHIIAEGQLIELKSGKNLTAERVFKSLPLEYAVKQVRGSGKNILVTFEDPNCGYCKKLAHELQGVKDITIYTFLYPILGEDSLEKSKAIWCASDKGKVWNEWMTNGKTIPLAPPKCDIAGLEKSTLLGRKLRLQGTPAMFFASGDVARGYMPLPEIEKRFAAGG